MINIRKKTKDRNEYKTFTTKLTIIDSEEYNEEAFFEGISTDQIKMKFQTKEGHVFSQIVEVYFGVDSLYNQIILATDLDEAVECIYPQFFIGKECNAVIATKSDWNKASIVAVF